MVSSTLARTCIGILVASCVACGGSSPPVEPDPPPAHVGTYRLDTVDGKHPPALTNIHLVTNCATYVMGGEIELRENQTYTRSTDFEDRCDEDINRVTVTNDGSYTLSGGAISFSGGSLEGGSWSGDVVLVEVRGTDLFDSDPVVRTFAYER